MAKEITVSMLQNEDHKLAGDSSTIIDSVIKIVREKSYLSQEQPLELRSRLADIGFDSAQIVDLILALEDSTGVSFDEDDLVAEELKTVGTLVQLVLRLSRSDGQSGD